MNWKAASADSGYNINMSPEEHMMWRGIEKDATYVGRLARDLSNPTLAAFAGVISLCMAPYLSLFAHESYRKLKRADPTLSSLLSRNVESIVAQSRHSLKLFEDTQRGITAQLAYFNDDILPAHHRRFLGNTWLKLARFLETDLGLYSYDQRLIATTHSATFHLGIEPDELLKEGAGPQIQVIYEEYGAYFARLGARLDAPGPTFVSYLDPKRFNQRPKDVRAERYYQRVFDGAHNRDVNALLTFFRSMLNFVSTVITASDGPPETEYTVWKIRFLTLYQVLGSLRVLRDEQLRTLTARSARYIEQIMRMPEARLIMEPAAKPFRNTLMHYNLDSRINPMRVDLNEPLFGLVPIYFPSHDTATFTAAVDQCIVATAAVMNEWADGEIPYGRTDTALRRYRST